MKTKILFILLAIAVAISLYLTYERTIIRQNFEIVDFSEEL